MRTEDLIDVISEVEDELLERSEKVTYKKKNVWMRWVSLAACACLAVGLVALGGRDAAKSESANDSEAPMEGFLSDDTIMENEAEADGDATTELKEPSANEPDYGYEETEHPLKDASSVYGAVSFYKYDGEEIKYYSMYESSKISQVLDELSKVSFEKVKDWPQEEMAYPVYGLNAGKEDGFTIHIAWSNGYWLTGDGEVLKADYDLSRLETEFEWDAENELDSMLLFPCAKYLCQTDEGWDADFMTSSEEISGQENVEMTITKQSDKTLNVRFDNESAYTWEYGEFYSIQVLLDGIWYDVPTVPGNWAFITIGYALPKGESVDKGYNFEMYGELPAGTYRIVVEGLVAEFEIE